VIARLGAKLLGLSGPALAWAAVAAGTVIAGLLALTLWQANVIQSKSEDIGRAQAHRHAAIQAAVNSEQAVLDINHRLRACVDGKKASIAAERKANARLERRQSEIDQAVDQERQAREEIYATDESCDAWRAALVCDRIGDRLRNNAAGADRPNRGSAGRGSNQGARGQD